MASNRQLSTVPITILSGYLGTGKTTLINRVLSAHQNLDHVAVLVNDFGSINIDQAIIAQAHPQGNILSLANGCICCSIANDFSSALEHLAGLDIHHVLLEASGVAEPAKLHRQCLYPGYHPHSNFVLVDALNFRKQCADKYVGYLVRLQAAQADQLVISKTDLVSEPHLRELPINWNKPNWHSDDPELLTLLIQPDATARIKTPNHDPAAANPNSAAFCSLTWQPPSSISLHKLNRILAGLPSYVQRVKGFVDTAEGVKQVHFVAGNIAFSDSPQAQGSHLVVIAPASKQAALEFHFRNLS